MYELRKETGTTFVYDYDGTHGEIKAFDFLYSHVMYHEGFKYYVGHTDGYPKLKKKGLDVPSAVDSFNSRNNLFIDIWKIIM